MFDKLSTVESRYEELMTRLGTVEVQSDPAEYRKSAKALSEIEPLVQRFREYKTVQKDIEGAQELVKTGDPEWKALGE
jgi:peptide chain release factor 1